jgi:glycerophosphoryl diester phosphodiesterase
MIPTSSGGARRRGDLESSDARWSGWRLTVPLVCLLGCQADPAAEPGGPPPFVAHAGGGIGELRYTNSREALDAAAVHGFRLVELDFSFTRDGHLVLVHRWADARRLFSIPTSGPREPVPTLEEFERAAPRVGLTPMTLRDLGDWLRQHEDVDVVTDFKHDALRGLESIQRELPELRNRFVPQIYALSDARPIRELGFDRVILTLYRSGLSNQAVERWLGEHEVYAVTLPLRRASPDFLRMLETAGVFVYTHTVNDVLEMRELRDRGVDGFYTDWLRPTEHGADGAR